MEAVVWVGAGAGLVGALIGAAAALGGQALQRRAEAKARASIELKGAVREVLVQSEAIALRAHDLTLLATNVGSVPGVVLRMVGVLAEVDLLAVFDRLHTTAESLQDAAVKVWLFADPETVELTASVVQRAMELVSAHHATPTWRVANMMRVAVMGRHAQDRVRIETARADLAVAHAALVGCVRTSLDLPDADFSLVRHLP